MLSVCAPGSREVNGEASSEEVLVDGVRERLGCGTGKSLSLGLGISAAKAAASFRDRTGTVHASVSKLSLIKIEPIL